MAQEAQKKKDQPNDPKEFEIQAMLLAEVVRRILKKRGEIDLSGKPILELKPVTEFMKRMRVTALGKFEGTTYISTVNFYQNTEEMESNKALGVIILYIHEEYIVKLLQRLNYPVTDEENEESLADGCGSFCNLIAGNFKSGLTQLGYIELEMSHFSSFRNELVNGVGFCPFQLQKYEISFDIGGKKRIMVDLSMGPIPRLFNPS